MNDINSEKEFAASAKKPQINNTANGSKPEVGYNYFVGKEIIGITNEQMNTLNRTEVEVQI